MTQQLAERQHGAVHYLRALRAGQPALRALEELVVPLHPVPRLPLLH